MSSDTPRTTRRRVLLGIGTGATVGLAGCSGNSDQGGTETATSTPTETPMPTETATDAPEETPMGSAMVRVAHLSPNAPNVDVYVDESAVLEDVPFGAVSEYLDVPAGERQVEITAAGDPDTSVFSGPVTVEDGTAYTVAAIGEIGDSADRMFEPLILQDDNSDPGGDTARVRVVHASPDAPAVDVTVASSGDALYDGVAYGQSGYVLLANIPSRSAAGYLSPDDEPADTPFDLLVAQDTESGTMSDGMDDPAMVRVAHLSPNAPNVDVYVDGSAALEDVPFGAVSGYLDVPAGTRTVEITAAGDPDASVFAGDVGVESGQPYTIAAIGETGDGADLMFEPLVLQEDNSAPDSGMARLRVVHASPDAPAVDVTVAAGDVLFDGVAYGGSGYVEVPAGDYTTQIRGDTDSNDGDVVAEYDVSLSGGQVYTAFAAGYLSPDDEPADTPFDLVVAQDTMA